MIRAFTLFALAACNGGTEPLPECVAADIACFDDVLLDLSLQSTVSTGVVTNTVEEGSFVSDIDASAGGFLAASTNPWVYVRFTDDGLERVDISDEESLTSLGWDLALHRFRVRMNGGASGPGCAEAGVVNGRTYDDVIVGDLEFTTLVQDAYYTDSCDLINDTSGLENSPQLAMGPWWSYPGCVATTKVPFLFRTGEGRLLKLVLPRYYGSGQAGCNQSGTPGQDSGNIRMRWSFLDEASN